MFGTERRIYVKILENIVEIVVVNGEVWEMGGGEGLVGAGIQEEDLRERERERWIE